MKTKRRLFSIKVAVVAFTAFLIMYCTFSTAQQEDKSNEGKSHAESLKEELNNQDLFVKLTRYEVMEKQQKLVRDLLGKYVLHSLLNESNIMAEAYYEKENPSVLWLIERWTSKTEWQRFNTTKQWKALLSITEGALVKPSRNILVTDLEPYSKEQWRRTAGVDDDPLTIMLFVDAKPGTEGNFKKVYHAAMPQFRNEPGVISYQLSQLDSDSTQFVTFEKFRSTDAFRYHLEFPPIQPVIDYLHTSIKKQPFQEGLHRLIEFAPLTRDTIKQD